MIRAAYVKAPWKVELRDIDVGPPGPGEVLVDVEACGICGTDVHWAEVRASEFQPFGHEIAGRVIAAGSGVHGPEVGQRVTMETSTFCGRCAVCRNGRVDLCTRAPSFWRRDGAMGFAEQMLAPVDCIVPADGLPPEAVSLAEPLGVAQDLVATSGATWDDDVLLVGPGPIGIMALALCRHLGARTIVAAGRSSDSARARLARRWADELVDVRETSYGDLAERYGGFDRILVTAPPHVVGDTVPAARYGGGDHLHRPRPRSRRDDHPGGGHLPLPQAPAQGVPRLTRSLAAPFDRPAAPWRRPVGGARQPSLPPHRHRSGPGHGRPRASRGREGRGDAGMSTVRVGIVGCGNIARFHLAGYRQAPDAEIVAVADPDEERGRAFADEAGATWHPDHGSMLGRGDLDAVSVTLPNHLHRRVCTDALREGVAVLCEKTLASNLRDGEAIIQAVEETGGRFQMGFMKRHHPVTRRFREYARRIGRPEAGHLTCYQTMTRWPMQGWLFDPRRGGGGILLHGGSHTLDLLCWALGDVPSAVVARTRVHPDAEVEHQAAGLLAFDDDLTIPFETGWFPHTRSGPFGTGWDEGITLRGPTGVARLELNRWDRSHELPFRAELYLEERGTWETFESEPTDYFVGEIEAFVDAVGAGHPLSPTVYDGYVVDLLIHSGYRSARADGRRVTIPEVPRGAVPNRSIGTGRYGPSTPASTRGSGCWTRPPPTSPPTDPGTTKRSSPRRRAPGAVPGTRS